MSFLQRLVLAVSLSVLSTSMIIAGGEYAFGSYVYKRQPGEVFMWGGSSCPNLSHVLDGSSLLRAGTYAALFNVPGMGTTYGSADGTHFTLPDMRGVFPRGSGAQTIGGIVYTGTRGTTAGDTFQGHFHSLNFTSIINFATGGAIDNLAGNRALGTLSVGAPTTDGSHGTPRTGSETAPANITFLFCIAY